jgi:steroid delta-isomerase-like uncharacterized protein
MLDKNKTMLSNTLTEILEHGNLDLVDERFASDYVGHTFTEIDGPEGVKKDFVSVLRRAFPDLKYTIDDQIAEDDRVAIRWTCSGTHKGEFQGIPATGKDVELSGISIFRLADSKIVEGWTNADMLGIMQQIGAVPEMERVS